MALRFPVALRLHAEDDVHLVPVALLDGFQAVWSGVDVPSFIAGFEVSSSLLGSPSLPSGFAGFRGKIAVGFGAAEGFLPAAVGADR